MTWAPPDIAPVCENALGNLTQCSSLGFIYLALLTQLFGKSVDENQSNGELNSDMQSSNDCSEDNSDSWQEVNGENIKKDESEKCIYDIIIVGGGSAGCVLASRLSEIKDWQILLLEAGPEEPNVTSIPSATPTMITSSIDWAYKTQPDNLTCLAQVGQSCVWPSGKSMGGSSSINGMVYMRGSRYDYDGWAAEGNDGWSFDEVLPYFKKSINLKDSENLNSDDIGGPLNVERYPYVDEMTKIIVQALQENGLPHVDLGLETKVGVNINLSTSKDGKRQSSNAAFIRPVRQERPNLHIITNAFATKVLIDPETKIAQGVQYYKNATFYKVYAKKEVIVSTGTIGSTKLLKLSGVGPQGELESLNIPVIANLKVGYNLQDHVSTYAFTISISNNSYTLVNEDQLRQDIENYYNEPDRKDGPLSTTSTLNSIAFINTNGSKEDPPNVQFHFVGRNTGDFNRDPTSYMASNVFPFSYYNGLGVYALLLTPKSRGRIVLNTTNPVFSPPLIYSGFFTVKEDMDALIKGMYFALSLQETETFKNSGIVFNKNPDIGCTEHEWASYDYFACLLTHHTATIFHPVGTCKMGPSWDEDAVVDPRFRVYGIKKLRVVDASTMRNIVRGNTNVPTIMMAEKGSDMIKEDNNM